MRATRRVLPLPALLAAALGLALLAVPVAGALHHHDGDAVGHPCAVCGAGHAPAVPFEGPPSPVAFERVPGHLAPAIAHAHSFDAAATAPARAPPLA